MKTQSKKIISLAVFAFLILVSVFVSKPAGRAISNGFSDVVKEVKDRIYEQTSLKISFSKLSPSIFSSVNLSGVTVLNENDELVASVKKVKVNYSLFNLIRKKYTDIVSSIVVDGVELKAEKLVPVIQKLAVNDDENVSENEFNLEYYVKYFKERFEISIPLNVSVKNVQVSYENRMVDTVLDIKKISIVYTTKRQQLELSVKSVISALIKANRMKVSSGITIKGLLLNGLEDSSLTFTLSDLRSGNYFFNKFNLNLSFVDNSFVLKTIQNTFPLLVDCSYSLSDGKLKASVKTDNLSPNQLFSSSVKSGIADLLKNTIINSDASVNLEDGELNWALNGSILSPYGDSNNLYQISVSGDDKSVDISNISASGENTEAFINGYFDIPSLSLAGYGEISKFILKNGTSISTELYFDPLDKGFMIFIPQVFIDEKTFTAIQMNLLPNNDSVDFTFEAYDYSHFENEEPSRLGIDGSYLVSSGFVQSSLSVNSFYLDSILDTALKFLDADTVSKLSGLSNRVNTFMFSSDAYFSTDFSTFSYNVPYILFANTAKENQALMASINGNETNISLNDMNLVLGQNSFRASFNVDRDPAGKDLFFQADFTASNIPYHFSGNYIQNSLHVTGDYNLALDIFFADDSSSSNVFAGNLLAEVFPVPVFGNTFTASVDSSFSYDKEQGPEIQLVRFELEEASGNFTSNPYLFLSGTGTRYGAQISEISYSDLFSVLNGNADLFVNSNNGIFEGAGLNLNLINSMTDESVSVLVSASNPLGIPLTLDSALKDFYFDCEIALNNMSLNRWTYVNNENNVITASLSFTGTAEHPYVGVNVENCSAYFNGYIAKISGSAYVEDDVLTSSSLNLNYNNIFFDLNNLDFSLSSFTGAMSGTILTEAAKKDVEVPLNLTVYDSTKKNGGIIPSSFAVKLSADDIGGSFFKKNISFYIDAKKYDDLYTFSSSDNLGLNGIYNRETSELNAQVNSEGYFSMNAAGIVSGPKLDLHLSKIVVDLHKVFSYFNLDEMIHVYSGNLNGSVHITGDMDNPEFSGAASVTKPEASLTTIIPDKISADKTMITLYQNEITVVENTYKVRKNYLLAAGCKIYLNKWNLDRIESRIYTKNKTGAPATLDLGVAVIEGMACVDLDLLYEKKILDVSGTVSAEKAEARFAINSLLAPKQQDPFFVHANIDVTLGSHAKLSVDPVLRCVFVPNTSFNVFYESDSENLALTGKFLLKSGDISYLNRSFYIKEGEIKFTNNEISGLLNPQVTIQAETRERDEKGDNIRIVFSTQNQYLQDLNPRFSSIPSRSENEILALLGQIVIGDSENVRDFIFTASDYAITSTIGRKFENTLRDFMNFDIFSVRTNVIKNALSIGTDRENTIKNYTFGNFFDNSTVYIGKYLGSSLYIDAMMHVTYNDSILDENFFKGGLLFQPEIGFEMESPFGNIRWNMAPNLDALMKKQFVPDSSVTLSWKFNF